MFRCLVSLLSGLASLALAQQTSFKPETGQRSLWIPFKTISGTPVASIAHNWTGKKKKNTATTVYVLACPTSEPQCAISPNLTLTEGISTAEYTTTNSAGMAVLGCSLAGSTSAVCSQVASGEGMVERGTTSTLAPSQIVYQAVNVTATATAGTTAASSSTSSAAAAVSTRGLWCMGGALGAGLVLLIAL
ncbi:Hypothetical predicted protein [Lecanosticta acicola]|uniref:GPI anchored protein n=1 Tax=Lecanosticta acicola TaxID=111012 RepID=A0AAI8Z384_9PEZI|nr:Hypothetical predicted protein [Lecanosticta acicola]